MRKRDLAGIAAPAVTAGILVGTVGTTLAEDNTSTVTVSSITIPSTPAKKGTPAQPSYPGQIQTQLGSFPFAYDTKTGILLCPKPPGYNGECLKHPTP